MALLGLVTLPFPTHVSFYSFIPDTSLTVKEWNVHPKVRPTTIFWASGSVGRSLSDWDALQIVGNPFEMPFQQ